MTYSTQLDALELLALARLDIKKERLEEALLKLKQATAGEFPAEVLAELGRLYARLGLQAKAKQAFKDFLALVPDALQERFELGLAHFEGKESGPALELWEQVLKKAPLHPPSLFYSSLALAQGGSFEQALQLGQTLLAKVNVENLYHGRAKDLVQRIEADPNYRKASAKVKAQTAPRVQH